MNTLQVAIKNKKPIKVYILGDYYDTMSYNEKLNRYEGDYGNIPMEKIPKIMAGVKEYDHLKLEAA